MTAVMAASGAGGPAGRLVIGPLYRWAGNAAVWAEIAGGMTLGGLLFLFAVWRSSAGDAPDLAAMTAVAQGETEPFADGPVMELRA